MAYHRNRAAAQVSLLALMMALPAGQALAQPEVEELIVTARKRDEALIDVPFSVNAISETKMRERGATNIEELSRNIANFTVQNLGPGQSQVAIRGISAGQIVRDQPGVKEQVGVYLDESVISLSLFTPDIELFDLNRVEVLRGPQGTLFGSGSLSGTVRYITNQPTTEGYQGAVEATVSSVDSGATGGELKGAMNIPLMDQVALRLVGYATSFPGYIDAVQPDGSIKEDVNSGSRLGFRAALLIQATENLSITPRILYQTIDVDGFNRVDIFNILSNQYTTTRPPYQLGDLQQFTQLQEKFEDDFLLGDLTIQYDFGDMALTSISTFQDRDVTVVRDATALTGSITGGSIGLPEDVYTLDAPLIDITDVKSFTQEVRLASTGEGPISWVIGAFYSDIQRDYSQALPVIGFEDLTGIPTAGPAAPKDTLYYSTVPYDQTQYAFFGEGTWSVTEQLDITAGLRWASYEEERTLTFDGIFAERTIGVPGSTEADDFAPRVIVAYKINDDITLNAQASKGFRLGGINDPLNRPLCTATDFATFNALSKPSFDNETVWNYEAGVKAEFGGSGVLTVAAFYADIENLQATIDAGSCSSRVIVNVPDAQSAGVEAEFSYRFNEAFDIAASASYNNAELTSSVVDALGMPIQGLRDGNRLPTVPEFQAAFSLNYVHEIEGNWTPFANLTWQYVGDRFTQISDQEDNPRSVSLFDIGDPTVSTLSFPLELPDYQVVNLRGGIRYGDFEAAIFVQNLTDERAWLSVDRERGLRARYGYQTNQPRTIGLTIRKSF